MVGYSEVTASRWEVEAEQAFCGGCDYFNEESYNGGENYFFTDDISSSYVQQALLNPIAQVADCDANCCSRAIADAYRVVGGECVTGTSGARASTTDPTRSLRPLRVERSQLA